MRKPAVRGRTEVYWCRDEVFASLGRKANFYLFDGEEPEMPDVAFVVLTIAVFAVLALAVRGVEHLVGSPSTATSSSAASPSAASPSATRVGSADARAGVAR